MQKSDIDLQKHTLNLYAGDYEEVQLMYPDIGAGPVIRKIVRAFIEQSKGQGDGFDPKVEIKL